MHGRERVEAYTARHSDMDATARGYRLSRACIRASVTLIVGVRVIHITSQPDPVQ